MRFVIICMCRITRVISPLSLFTLIVHFIFLFASRFIFHARLCLVFLPFVIYLLFCFIIVSKSIPISPFSINHVHHDFAIKFYLCISNIYLLSQHYRISYRFTFRNKRIIIASLVPSSSRKGILVLIFYPSPHVPLTSYRCVYIDVHDDLDISQVV